MNPKDLKEIEPYDENQPKLEDAWLAHKALDKLVEEQQEKLDAAVKRIQQEYDWLLHQARSVYYETLGKLMHPAVGFSAEDVERHINKRHNEAHPLPNEDEGGIRFFTLPPR